MSGGVVECHLRLGLVVGSYHEGDDGELSKTWSHGQDLAESGCKDTCKLCRTYKMIKNLAHAISNKQINQVTE